MLVGQFYFNHQEIQDRNHWAKAQLVEAITQTCRALQLNSHGPLMKSWRIHPLRWPKHKNNVPTSQDNLRNLKDNTLSIANPVAHAVSGKFLKGSMQQWGRGFSTARLPPMTHSTEDYRTTKSQNMVNWKEPIRIESNSWPWARHAALPSKGVKDQPRTKSFLANLLSRSWMIFCCVYTILWRWTTGKSLPKKEFMYSLAVRYLEGRGKGREKESKNLKETKTAITQGFSFQKKIQDHICNGNKHFSYMLTVFQISRYVSSLSYNSLRGWIVCSIQVSTLRPTGE